MVSPMKRVFRWLFLCDVILKHEVAGCPAQHTATNCVSDRWRLLCWTFLCTCLWTRLEPSLVNFLTILCCLALLNFLVQFLTHDPVMAPVSVTSGLKVLLIFTALNALTVLTSHNGLYLSYEYLVKKLILREYQLLHFWCPNVYLVLISITLLTFVLRQLPARASRILSQTY